MADFLNQVLPAIERALLLDLPEVEYKRRDGVALRRPHKGDIQVYAFPQTWANGAMGFDVGVATQGFVTAYVAVVILEQRVASVYFGGMLAYCVPVSSDLMHDIGRQNMHDVRGAHRHYGRDPRKTLQPEAGESAGETA